MLDKKTVSKNWFGIMQVDRGSYFVTEAFNGEMQRNE